MVKNLKINRKPQQRYARYSKNDYLTRKKKLWQKIAVPRLARTREDKVKTRNSPVACSVEISEVEE